MSNLRKKIQELQQASQVGQKEEEERARKERVIAYLDGRLEKRRQDIMDGTSTHSDAREAKAQRESYLRKQEQREGGRMDSNLGENPRCIAQTAQDTRCKNDARIGSEYCSRHSPERAELRSEAARKAARTRKMGNLTLSQEASEIKARLRTLADELLAERVSPSIAAVVVQAENAILRAVEVERKVVELEEALPMLEELQEQMKREKKSGYYRG